VKRESIFSITENGERHYCTTKIYGGIAGIALRFVKNTKDESGKLQPLIDRLDRVRRITPEQWQDIADAPYEADQFFSFIEVDADNNMVCADEDGEEERSYMEVPLHLLLEVAASMIHPHRHTGYDSLDKKRFWRELMQRMRK